MSDEAGGIYKKCTTKCCMKLNVRCSLLFFVGIVSRKKQCYFKYMCMSIRCMSIHLLYMDKYIILDYSERVLISCVVCTYIYLSGITYICSCWVDWCDWRGCARGCTRVATLRKTRQFLEKHCENTPIFEIRQSVTDRQTDRQTERQTERQTDRQKMTCIYKKCQHHTNMGL